MAKNTPAPPPSSSSRGNTDRGRRGHGRGRGSAGGEAESSSAFRVHWETTIAPGCTSKMVQWLVDHPVDCIVLFLEDKSTPCPQGQPSGSNKQEIYGVTAKIVFNGDLEYRGLFMLQPEKFSEVVQNHIGISKRLYYDQAKNFQQTGNGIAPTEISEGDPEYNNLLESVLEAFPWYMDLHGLWKGIPSISLKAAINSTLGISHGAQLLSIVKKTSTTTASDSSSEPPMSDCHTCTANEPS
ncbi:hypothetical protein PAXRUDRAFT_835175 [Paxillus rubicundulus Ve08.2h10]|uniref:Uncharacterized protein n=1 Tax=Paxillus rubicundulus Ve08.2h10 TaxID=930991 RepID=A0A0D0C0Z0_9AGAM|nr:hypothetical protein PAXRUDRAFT_835175 [Paxillus rubicundulus Ve08.2h10]